MRKDSFENPGPHDMGIEFPHGEHGPGELFIDGREFLGTFEDSSAGKAAAETMAKAYQGTIESFGVSIDSVDPKTNKVTKWEREKGFSVWR